MALFAGANPKFKILMKGSRDGFAGKTFGKLVKGHEPTLHIIQTAQGHIFGGYTNLDFKLSSGYVKGTGKTWLFTQTKTGFTRINRKAKPYSK
jgi:hypothetical protein